MAALDLQIDRMKEKADEEDAQSGGEGILGRLLMGRGSSSGGFLGGLSGIFGKLPLVGDQLSSIAEKLGESGGEEGGEEGGGMVEALGSVAGSAAGLSAVAGVVGAVVTEVAALASGLTAAGLGVGAFGALAYPTIEAVTGALGDTKAQLDKLPAPVRMLVGETKNLKGQFSGMAKAMQPEVAQVFSQVLGIISDHMKIILPFAQAAGPALEKVFAMVNKGLDSKSFGEFAGYMHSLEGPAIEAIGSGMAGLVKDVMQLLTVMSQKDVINGINIAFRLLGAVLTILTGIVKGSMLWWDHFTELVRGTMSAFDEARHASASFAHGVAQDFDTVRHASASFAHDVARDFDAIRHDIAEGAHDVAHGFDDVRGAIATGTDKTLSYVKSHWRAIRAFLVDPVGMAVYEIRRHWAAIEDDAKAMARQVSAAFDTVRHGAAALGHDVASSFGTARHDISAWAGEVQHDIASAWDGARHSTAAFLDSLPHMVGAGFASSRHQSSVELDGMLHDIASAWDQARHSTAAGVDGVVSYVRSLPGKILSALASLPGRMESAGRSVIDGLIHGIESAAGDIPGIMKSLAGDVESYFTDPLKIFSPSKVFEAHGRNIVMGIINGVNGASGQLRNTMRQLGTSVAAAGLGNAGHGALAGAGGIAKVQVEFIPGGGDAFIRWLRNQVRAKGGNVQQVLGQRAG